MKNSKFGLLLALLLATGMWVYVRRVLVPYQRAEAVAHDHPRANLSDLYPRWLGARELLLHGRDPYSAEVTREIQIGYYGRVLDPSRPGDPQDQQAFAYPVYVVFFLAPIVGVPFPLIRTLFCAILLLLVVANVIMWLRALRWRPSNLRISMVILLLLGSVPVVKALELQQLTLMVVAMLGACVLLLVNGKLLLAGIVLACATVKPQLVLPLAVWLIVWSLSNWHRRKAFVLGFLLTLTILLAAGEWILSGWVREFLHAVAVYRQYTDASSLLGDLTNQTWEPVLALTVLLTTAVVCWRSRHDSQHCPRFAFIFALVAGVTLVIIPTVSASAYNQVLLLPGILFLIRDGPSLWGKNKLARLVWTLAASCLFWPWVAALGLTIASFLLPATSVQKAWMLPFYTNLATPVAVLGLLFQYSFRVLHSSQLPSASGQY